MTTRKEKFEADRKKMLADKKKYRFDKNGDRIYPIFQDDMVSDEDFKVNEAGERLVCLYKNQKQKDESEASWEASKKEEKEWEKEWDVIKRDIDRLDREEEEENKKKEQNEGHIRKFYNFICWIATLAVLASTVWSFHLFFSIGRWKDADIVGYIVKIVGCIVFGSMTAGMFFFGISTIVFLLQIHYCRWLANGMNPESF